jgi:pre-mRNA-splicing factor 18
LRYSIFIIEEFGIFKDVKSTPISNTSSPRPGTTPDPEHQKAETSFNISNEETVRRLRAKGQPIRLFGESDKDRRLRLRALELIEEKGHDRQAGQNDFKKALEDVENQEREMKSKNKGKRKDDSEFSAGGVLDLSLIKSDPDKLYPLIYYALKRTLKEWEEAMDERPGVCTHACRTRNVLNSFLIDNIKRSTQGKLAAATQVQSAQYLKPLFKALRSRVRLHCYFCLIRSFCRLTFDNTSHLQPTFSLA